MTYDEQALVTLSAQFNLTDSDSTITALHHELVGLICSLDRLDKLKKKIFYGKDVEVPSTPSLPDGRGEIDPDFLHAVMGLATEAGELLESAYDVLFNDRYPDKVNIGEEAGDIEWYGALLRRYLGRTQADIQQQNIAKLQARYGGGFSSDRAVNRDLDVERKTLESSTSN